MLTAVARHDREAMPVHAPVQNLVLYLTDDCNLRCSYCFVPKGARRMSADIARKAVDFFLSRHISGTCQRLGITFFGGEPFLEPERMREVMEYARAARPNVHKWVTFSAILTPTLCGRVLPTFAGRARSKKKGLARRPAPLGLAPFFGASRVGWAFSSTREAAPPSQPGPGSPGPRVPSAPGLPPSSSARPGG